METKIEDECPSCKEIVELRHKYDAAHGIRGTHMAGSERYECPHCGRTIYATEGRKLGLKFILD